VFFRGVIVGWVVNGATIAFGTDVGTIGGSAATDAGGKAAVTFTAGTATGTATVTAAYGGLSTTTQIELITSSSAAIALEASETSLQVTGTGGTEISQITATVWDGNGNLVPAGTAVTFAVSPDGTFGNGQSTYQVLTNASGQATVTYQSGSTSGTKVFTATSGSASGSAPLILVASGPAAQIVIGSDSGMTATDASNGLVSTELGAFITDTYSNPIPDSTEVHFELTGANADTAAITTIVETDEYGVAVATITYGMEAAGVTITVRVTCGAVTETKDIVLPTP